MRRRVIRYQPVDISLGLGGGALVLYNLCKQAPRCIDRCREPGLDIRECYVCALRYQGIRVKRDSAVSVRDSERVKARKRAYALQRTDRYKGMVGQQCWHYPCASAEWS